MHNSYWTSIVIMDLCLMMVGWVVLLNDGRVGCA